MNEPVASSDNAATPPAKEAAAPARSIGERLRAGRERSGLSVPATAEKLHLDPRIIEALEGDRFAEVGVPVYVRGHLKRYGDFVGEPGAELVAMYSARENRVVAPDLTQIPHAERRVDPQRLVAPLVALGCVAVVAIAVWWVLTGSRASSGSAPAVDIAQMAGEVVPEAAPIATGDATAMPVATSAATNAPAPPAGSPLPARREAAGTLTTASNTTAQAVVPATSAPVQAIASTDAAAAPPSREMRLRLELTNDSWVEVYDAQGERLFYDVASAGSVQRVSGQGPLRVVLGHAAGVAVAVDGQAREIPANAVRGEAARFVVNRSGTLSRSRQ